MKKLIACVLLLFFAIGIVFRHSPAQVVYVPRPVFCPTLSNAPCSQIPAYIGPDPRLGGSNDYPGLIGFPPTTPNEDVETPFDNMAWQMFVALNWAASATKQPAAIGLTTRGQRVWQQYRKVSDLFGNSTVRGQCPSALALPVISIGSDGQGNPQPNNEEYLQASTNQPLIDINGNWTLFERRVNDVEAQYLQAPNGDSSQTLTTLAGQQAFLQNPQNVVKFTASDATPIGKPGSIEIKTAWRILDRSRGDDPSRFYTQEAMLAVPGDLVQGGSKICATVTLGLVGMHIIQRNPVDKKHPALLPEWIWATFEHVDNAPLAELPCSVNSSCTGINKDTCGQAAPVTGTRYSYYDQNANTFGTNIRPQSTAPNIADYFWNSKPPYAQGATTPGSAKPQATRCFSIYPTTEKLNRQWRAELAKYKTPLQNYMLIGTQWGASVFVHDIDFNLLRNGVPAMLSNITLETYIQMYTVSDPKKGGPGSCIGCHSGANLSVGTKPLSDFSFLPGLVDPKTARSKVNTAK
ncbi:MAG TPA: hypothetical protein VE961_27855 [Pyrinomonadaceae bacterium]|nr:hypothetical protein [Pyrinomonadaceae bacterium]